MKQLDDWAAGRIPCLVLPDTLVVSEPMFSQTLPGKVTVRIWLDAIWATRRRGGALALTYGTLNDGFGASKNLGRDVHADAVARKLDPAHGFDETRDRIMRLEKGELTGYRIASPARLRFIAAALREAAAAIEAGGEDEVLVLPDGMLGWWDLARV